MTEPNPLVTEAVVRRYVAATAMPEGMPIRYSSWQEFYRALDGLVAAHNENPTCQIIDLEQAVILSTSQKTAELELGRKGFRQVGICSYLLPDDFCYRPAYMEPAYNLAGTNVHVDLKPLELAAMWGKTRDDLVVVVPLRHDTLGMPLEYGRVYVYSGDNS